LYNVIKYKVKGQAEHAFKGGIRAHHGIVTNFFVHHCELFPRRQILWARV
jgi:hypothetical protein